MHARAALRWHAPTGACVSSSNRRAVTATGTSGRVRAAPCRRVATRAAGESSTERQVFDEAELAQSGAIVSAHGLRGEVRVMPFTDFVEERFFSPCTQWLEDEAQGRSASGEYNKPAGTLSKINISGGREVTTKGRNECIVKIRGVNDRNAAEALLGRRMYVLASERPSLREADVGDGDDDFYAQELQGLRVVLKEGGDEVGKVIDVFRGAGTHDLLKVEVPPLPGSDADDENAAGDGEKRKTKPPGEFVYVPFVKDIVPTVDVPNGFLEITPPPGLLDLRQRASKPKKQRVVAPPPKKKST